MSKNRVNQGDEGGFLRKRLGFLQGLLVVAALLCLLAGNAIAQTMNPNPLTAAFIQGPGGVVYNQNHTHSTGTITLNSIAGGSLLVTDNTTLTFSGNTNTGSFLSSGRGAAIYISGYGTYSIVADLGSTILFTNNSVDFEGGALWNGGTLTLTRGVFERNKSDMYGGAITNYGTLTLNDVRFTENTATSSWGGAIENWATGATLAVNTGTFERNQAPHGGAIANYGTSLILSDVTFTGNTATGYGSSIFYQNGHGGAIYNEGSITLTRGTLTNNTAIEFGGALYVTSYGGTTTLTDVEFTTNEAMDGGAVYITGGTLTLGGNVTFTNNTTTSTTTGRGGALFFAGGTVTNTGTATFTGNTANQGGAIYNAGGGSLTFNNIVFTNNTATENGGAIYNNGAILTLNNATFTGNSAVLGNAIYNAGGGTINFNVTTQNQTFIEDDIYIEDTNNRFNIDVASGYTLAMQKDSLALGDNSVVTVTKTGAGRLEFEEDNDFGGTAVNLHISEGIFHLSRSTPGTFLNLGSGDLVLTGTAEWELDPYTTAPNTEVRTTTGTMNLASGSMLAFDLTGADPLTDRMLTLTATNQNSVAINSDVFVNVAVTALNTIEDIILLEITNPTSLDRSTLPGAIWGLNAAGTARERYVAGRTGTDPKYGYKIDSIVDPGKVLISIAAITSVSGLDGPLTWTGADPDATGNKFWKNTPTDNTNANWYGRMVDTSTPGVVTILPVGTFLNGDDVRFDLATGDTVSVDSAGVTAGTMNIEGIGNWVFNGGNINGNNLTVGTQAAPFTGTVTFNNTNTFSAILLQSGSTNVVGSSSELNGGTIVVGATGTASLSLMSGGSVSANGAIQIGFGGTGNGTVTVGTGSTLTGTVVNVGGYTGSNGPGTLAGSGTVKGDVTVSSTGTLSPGDSAGAIGTLTIDGNLSLNGGTLVINVGTDPLTGNNISDLIDVQGSATFAGTDNLVAVTGNAAPGRYTFLTTASDMATNAAQAFMGVAGTGPDGYSYARGDSGVQFALDASAPSGRDYKTLQLVLDSSGTITLHWTGDGNGIWQSTAAVGFNNWTDRTGSEQFFRDDDSVVFDNTADISKRNVTVASGGVTANTVEINSNGYNFSGGTITATGAVTVAPNVSVGLDITAGRTAVIADSVTFGNGSALNITGYTASDIYPSATWTLIQSNNIITLPTHTVLGQPTVDYISTNARLSEDAKAIVVDAALTWFSTASNRPAHGDFTVDNTIDGVENVFTLGAKLVDNLDSSNWRTNDPNDPDSKSDWDGKSLTKLGEGTLVLTADNEYTGMTTVEAGTLQLGNGGTSGWVAGDIVNNANVVFNRADTMEFTQNIIGNGITTIAKGTFQIGDGGDTGWVDTDIVNDAKVVFNRTAGPLYDNVISGSGITEVKGGGLVTGNNARIETDLYVQAGAMFGGHGKTTGLLTLEDGATLSPGGDNDTGIFTADGGITFESNSTYQYEIDGLNGTSDLLVVGGDVEIEHDAKLNVNFVSGRGRLGNEYQVISATREQFIDSTPFALDGFWSWRFGQELRGDGYWITWLGFADSIQPYGGTPNAVRTAVKMDEIVNSNLDYGVAGLYAALDGQTSPGSMKNAFAQLHGEVFASNKEAAAQLQRNFQQLLPNGREYYSQATLPKKWNRWGTLTGGWENRKSIGQYSSYDLSSVGVAAGIDRTITRRVLFGAAFGFDHANQKFGSINSKAQIDAFRTMIYNSWYNGDYFIDAYGGYTKNEHRTKRNINIAGLPYTTAKSRYDDDMGSVGLNAGRVWKFGDMMVTPSIGVQYIRLFTPDVRETNGGDANLFVRGDYYESFRMPISAKVSKIFSVKNGIILTPEARASYSREFSNDTASVLTSFDRVRSVSFVAEGGEWGRHSGHLGVGLGAVRKQFSFRIDYDFTVYNHTSLNEFGASMGMQW